MLYINVTPYIDNNAITNLEMHDFLLRRMKYTNGSSIKISIYEVVKVTKFPSGANLIKDKYNFLNSM